MIYCAKAYNKKQGESKMELNLNINKIDVLLTDGTDKVTIYINDCNPPFPAMSDYSCNLNFECAKGIGEQYVIDNFGIKPNIIDARIQNF